MSNKSIATIATMGIDIGKNSFHVVGLDRRRDRAAAEVVTRPLYDYRLRQYHGAAPHPAGRRRGAFTMPDSHHNTPLSIEGLIALATRLFHYAGSTPTAP